MLVLLIGTLLQAVAKWPAPLPRELRTGAKGIKRRAFAQEHSHGGGTQ